MKLTFKKKSYDQVNIENLAYIFFMPILIDFFNVVINQFGIGNSSSLTIFIYLVSLIAILWRCRKHICVNSLLLLLAVYLLFALSYVLFPENRNYMISTEMMIVYGFFFPVACISCWQINNWDDFFCVIEKYAYITIFLSLIIILFLNYQLYLVYMGFSYALLPFIASMYRAFRLKHNKIATVVFFVGLSCILIFGARAAVGFLLLYLVVFEITRADKGLTFKLMYNICVCFAAIIVYYSWDWILTQLSNSSSLSNSYIIQELLKGKLLESKTRVVLYESCKNRISTVGLSVSGFFGDRQFCAGFAYPHNIIYELLMQWGWLGGAVVIIGAGTVFCRCLIHIEKQRRDIAIFLIITVFLRYIISGSYLVEGKFWIALFVIMALKRGWRRSANLLDYEKMLD